MSFSSSAVRALRALPSVAFFTVGSLGLAVGCSSSSNDQSANASEWAAKFCDLLGPCCAKYDLPTDGEICRRLYSLPYGFDAAMGDACLREMKAAQSNPDFCASGNKVAPSCAKVYPTSGPTPGTKKPGEACSNDGDCATSTLGKVTCASKTDATTHVTTSVCQVAVAGKEGDGPCTATVDGNVTYGSGSSASMPPAQVIVCDVKDGVFCPSTSSTGPAPTCTRPADVGSACVDSFGGFSCVKGAYCSGSPATCKARLALGATCETFGSNCIEGAYCDETSLKCTSQLAEGAACTTSEQCSTHSCTNKKCAKPDLSGFGYLLICGPPKTATGG
jgi:hypothetical protein